MISAVLLRPNKVKSIEIKLNSKYHNQGYKFWVLNKYDTFLPLFNYFPPSPVLNGVALIS